MALGVFTSAGIVDLQLPEQGAITSVGDLLLYSLGELEAIADEKGGIREAFWRSLMRSGAKSPRRPPHTDCTRTVHHRRDACRLNLSAI